MTKSLEEARAKHETTRLANLEMLARIQRRLEQEPSDTDLIDWSDVGTQMQSAALFAEMVEVLKCR